MKKAFTVLAAFALLLSLSACSSTANEESSSPPQQSGSQTSASEEESDSPGASSAPPKNRVDRQIFPRPPKQALNHWSFISPGQAILKMLQSLFRARRIPIFLRLCLPHPTAMIMILFWMWHRRNRRKTRALQFPAASKTLTSMMLSMWDSPTGGAICR